MTLNELGFEVSALGFDNIYDIDYNFVSAANRALSSIYSRRKICESARLFIRDATPSSVINEIRHRGGESITLSLAGRAYSMYVSGIGEYTISDSRGIRKENFSTSGSLIRGFISDTATICFSGDYSYTVFNLATYDEIYSELCEDIPDGSENRIINLRSLFDDFHSFVSPPKDKRGNIIECAELCDGKMKIPANYEGEIHLVYRRLPRKILLDNKESPIDVPPEYEQLLPLLTASYFWLDSDPEKAKYYRQLFEESINNLDKTSYDEINIGYLDVNGWA